MLSDGPYFSAFVDADDGHGSSLLVLPDMDGNGRLDMAFGSPLANSNDGSFSVVFAANGPLPLYGQSKRSEFIAPGLAPGHTGRFGSALEYLGDVHQDGMYGLAVSAPLLSDGTVFMLKFDAVAKSILLIATLAGSDASGGLEVARFGSAICSLGDLNADGVVDLAFGAVATGGFKGTVVTGTMNSTLDGFSSATETFASEEPALDGVMLADAGWFGASCAAAGTHIPGLGSSSTWGTGPEGSLGIWLAVGQPAVSQGKVWMIALDETASRDFSKPIRVLELAGAAGAWVGSSILCIGDVVGADGIPELLVGRPDLGSYGAVLVAHMNQTRQLQAAPAFNAGGNQMGGYGDHASSGDGFGSAIAAVQDTSVDVKLSILVGAPSDNSNSGFHHVITKFPIASLDSCRPPIAGVFSLVNSTVAASDSTSFQASSLADMQVGASIATAADFDKNGAAELLLGSQNEGGAGEVWLLFMADATSVSSVVRLSQGTQGSSNFPAIPSVSEKGLTVEYIGHVPGAQSSHAMAVGFPERDAAGKTALGTVYLVSLNPAGGAIGFDEWVPGTGSFEHVPVSTENTFFGASLARLPDLNPGTGLGGGVPELAIGAPGHGTGSGMVVLAFIESATAGAHSTALLYQGSPHVLDGSNFLEGAFGSSIAYLGLPETPSVSVPTFILAVGAPEGGEGSGAVYILEMTAIGLLVGFSQVTGSLQGMPQDWADPHSLGSAVAHAGDFNEDGIPDLWIGDREAGSIYLLAWDGYENVLSLEAFIHTYPLLNIGNLPWDGGFGSSLAVFPGLHPGHTLLLAGLPHADVGGSSDAGDVLFVNLEVSAYSNHSKLQTSDFLTATRIAAGTRGYNASAVSFGTFGSSMHGIGDINGDGVLDIAVGTPGDTSYSGSAVGSVALLCLGPDSDVVAMYTLHPANFSAPASSGLRFGRAVLAFADLNEDGTMDLAVGTAGGITGHGGVYILFLGSMGSVVSFNDLGPGDFSIDTNFYPDPDIGASFTTSCLHGRSGLPALVIGTPGYNYDSGAVIIANLTVSATVDSPALLNKQTPGLTSVDSNGRFGASLATLSDAYDGRVIFAVGAPHADSYYGKVYLVEVDEALGVSLKSTISTASPGIPSSSGPVGLGVSLAAVRASQGTAIADLLVGAPMLGLDAYGSSDIGSLLRVKLDASGSVQHVKQSTVLPVSDASMRFSSSIAVLPRLRGAGLGASVLVGAPGDDQDGQTSAGSIFVLDTDLGLNPPPPLCGGINDDIVNQHGVLQPGMPRAPAPAEESFGSGIAWVGDLNEDGTPDLAVGASGGGSNGGAVYILLLQTRIPTVALFVELDAVQIGVSGGGPPGIGQGLAFLGDAGGEWESKLAIGVPTNDDIGFLQVVELTASGSVGWTKRVSPLAPTEPNAITLGNIGTAYYGTSLATAPDLNGDGHPELIGGMPGFQNAGGSGGIVLTIFGTGASTLHHVHVGQGLPATEGLMGAVPLLWGRLGESVAVLDADLTARTLLVAAGAPYVDSKGALYLFKFHASGVLLNVTMIGSSVLYTPPHVSAFVAAHLVSKFGHSLAPAGDVDGDGAQDIWVGCSGWNSAEGAAFLLHLGPGGELQNVSRISNQTQGFAGAVFGGDELGSALASTSTWTGGRSVLAMGASGASIHSPDDGRVFLVELNTGPPAASPSFPSGTVQSVSSSSFDNPAAHLHFGAAMAGIGDFYEDGNSNLEVAVGLPGSADGGACTTGSVSLLIMDVGGSVMSFDTIHGSNLPVPPTSCAASGNTPALFGSSIAAIHNLRGDGSTVLAVGSPGMHFSSKAGAGALFLIPAFQRPQSTRITWDDVGSGLLAGQGAPHLGASVGALCDCSADEVPDVMVGAPGFQVQSSSPDGAVFFLALHSNGSVRHAQAVIHRGMPGLSQLPAGARFGASLALVERSVGANSALVAVGAPHSLAGAGIVFLIEMALAGSVTQVSEVSRDHAQFSSAVLGALSPGPSAAFGSALAAGDVNSDGIMDLLIGAENATSAVSGNKTGAMYVFRRGPAQQPAERVMWPFTASLGDGDRLGSAFAFFDNSTTATGALLAVGLPGRDSLEYENEGIVLMAHTSLDGPGQIPATCEPGIPQVSSFPEVMHASIISNGSGIDPATFPDWSTGDRLGCSVASLGDLDRNGVPDIVMGLKGHSESASSGGAVWIMFMDIAGQVSSSTLLNGDAVGFPSLPANSNFGWSVALFRKPTMSNPLEILVGAPGQNAGKGAVYWLELTNAGGIAYFERFGVLDTLSDDLGSGAAFGRSVAALQDLNNDGLPDFAAGAPLDDADDGSVRIVFTRGRGEMKFFTTISSTSDAFHVAPGLLLAPGSGTKFGSALAHLVDYSTGGHTALAVGVPALDAQGGVWILELDVDGSVRNQNLIRALHHLLSNLQTYVSEWGASLAPSAKLDVTDSTPDLWVGSPGMVDPWTGVAAGGVFGITFNAPQGTTTAGEQWLNPSVQWINTTQFELSGHPPTQAGRLGSSMAALTPAFSGVPGRTGLLVGAAKLTPVGQGTWGGAYVLDTTLPGRPISGSPPTANGPAPLVHSSFETSYGVLGVGARFGSSMAMISENATVALVAVGAPETQLMGTGGAGAVLFYQYSEGVLSTPRMKGLRDFMPSATLNSDQHFGAAVSSAGDLNRDGVVDLAVGMPGWAGNQGAVLIVPLAGDFSGKEVTSAVTMLRDGLNGFSSPAGAGPAPRLGSSLANGATQPITRFTTLFIGAPGGGSGQGSVEAVLLAVDGHAAAQATVAIESESDSGFGLAIAYLGPASGVQGSSMLAIGAPEEDGRGLVHVFIMFDSWPLAPQLWTTVSQPVTQAGVPHSHGSRFGASLHLYGDTNEDGIPDMFVGAPGAGLNQEGALFALQLSNSSAPTNVLDWVVLSETRGGLHQNIKPSSFLGSAVLPLRYSPSPSGDMRLLVGVPGRGNSGSVLQVVSTLGATREMARKPEPLPAARFLMPFSTPGLVQVGDEFARSAVGLRRSDTHTHLVIGSPGAAGGVGRVWLSSVPSMSAGASGLFIHIDPENGTTPEFALFPVQRFGSALCGAGDLTGDGSDELVVGSPGEAIGTSMGLLLVLDLAAPSERKGLAGIAATELRGGMAGMEFGFALASGCRSNSGAAALIFAGAPCGPKPSCAGSVFALYLNAAGWRESHTELHGSTFGFSVSARFGSSIAVLSASLEDGHTLAIGAPGAHSGDGDIALVTYSAVTEESRLISRLRSAGQAGFMVPVPQGYGFGQVLASAGDVMGDGMADLVIGMPGELASGFTGPGGLLLAFLAPDGNISHTTALGPTAGGLTAEQAAGGLGGALAGWPYKIPGEVVLVVGAPQQAGTGKAFHLRLRSHTAVNRSTCAVDCPGAGSGFCHPPALNSSSQNHSTPVQGPSPSPTASATPSTSTSPAQTSATATSSASPSVSGSPSAPLPGATISPTSSPTGSPGQAPSPSGAASSTTPSPSPSALPPSTCESQWWAVCVSGRGPAQPGASASPSPAAASNTAVSRLAVLPGAWCDGCTSAAHLFLASTQSQFGGVHVCPRFGACESGGEGGSQLRCAAGHVGAACAGCKAGHAPPNGSPCAPCESCPETDAVFSAGLAVFVVAATIGFVVLSVRGVQLRGQLTQDLLIGSARMLLGYIALMGYVTMALSPFTESTLGLGSRAVTREQWYEACGRGQGRHLQQVSPLTGSLQAAAGNASSSPWVSDASLYSPEPPASAGSKFAWVSDAFRLAASLTGALPPSSIPAASCALGHTAFATQVRAMFGLAGIVLVGIAVVFGVLELGFAKPGAPKPVRPSAAKPRSLTANPLLLSTAKSTKKSRAGEGPSKGSGTLGGTGSLATAQLVLWTLLRFLLSVYLLAWGAVVAASMQVLAPAWALPSGTYAFPTSLAVDITETGDLTVVAWLSLVLHAAVVPFLAVLVLRARAAALLHEDHHTSATLAVMTAGYRLQLSPRQARQVTKRTLAASGSGASNSAQQAVAVALSVRMSRRMEQRCCGVAKFVPSHAFAVLRLLQNAIVLSCLWLTTNMVVRSVVMGLAVSTLLLLTYSLRPYSLPAHNTQDMQVSVTVLLHVILLSAFPGDSTVAILLLTVHCLTAGSILWSILRGASSYVRSFSATVRKQIHTLLPEVAVAQGAVQDAEGVAASALPSASLVCQALLSRAGCTWCKPRPASTHPLRSGTQQWADLPQVASSVLATANASSKQDVAAALEAESDGIFGSAPRLVCPCGSGRATSSGVEDEALALAVRQAVGSGALGSSGSLRKPAAGSVLATLTNARSSRRLLLPATRSKSIASSKSMGRVAFDSMVLSAAGGGEGSGPSTGTFQPQRTRSRSKRLLP